MSGKQVPQADFSGLSPLSTRFSISGPVEPEIPERSDGYRVVPASQVSANPRNPREELGDLTELIAILEAEGQLQACVAMTRDAYLKAYPEDASLIGQSQFVVIAGSRRLAAIQASTELGDVKIEIHDELADDPQKLQRAALSENINRKNFKPLEEARAISNFIESMDGVRGAQRQAAALLNRTPSWVNQRLVLLKLVPELQALVDAEELPVKIARQIGTKPEAEQLAALEAWRNRGSDQASRRTPVEDPSPQDSAVAQSGRTEAVPTQSASPASEVKPAYVDKLETATPAEGEVMPAEAPVSKQSDTVPRTPAVESAHSEAGVPAQSLAVVHTTTTVQEIAAQLRERLDADERRKLADLLTAEDHEFLAST